MKGSSSDVKHEARSQVHGVSGIGRWARRRSMGTCAGAGICLAIAVLSMTGCEGSSSKRAALTEPEVKRLTLAMKPNRPDQLVVCGETITWEDAIASLPEEAASGPSLYGKSR